MAAKRMSVPPMEESAESEELLKEILLGTTGTVGDRFFQSLVLHLCRAIDADYAFIGELAGEEGEIVRTIAMSSESQLSEPFSFPLAGTPCEEVLRTGFLCCHSGVRERFPLDHLAAKMGVESYIGLPLLGEAEEVLGLMAILSRSPLVKRDLAGALLNFFATRASAELERRHAQRRQQDQILFLQQMMDAIPAPIFYKGIDGRYLGSNRAFQNFLGLPGEQIQGRTLYEVAPSDLARQYHRADLELMSRGGTQTYESEVLYADGKRREVIFQKAAFHDSCGKTGGLVGTMIDISERKQAERQIRKLIYYDPLTGLPNRAHFKDRLEQTLRDAARTEKKVAILVLDLDKLRQINQTLGHETGDQYLQMTAARLSACAKEGDMVGRLGGNKFFLLRADLPPEEDISLAARQIQEQITQPLLIRRQEISSTVSIGIALFPEDALLADELLRCADAARTEAKAQGGSHFRFYSPEANRAALDRLMMEIDLRRGIVRNEFFLVYQPQVTSRDNHLVGVEALVRWNHPTRGLISPAEFIPLAERSGLIHPLGEWILRAACTDARRWQDAGWNFHLSVNISPVQFHQSRIDRWVPRILKETGLSPDRLMLELTESTMMAHIEDYLPSIEALQTLGIQISVDDFGTGYSSLSYLKRLPLNCLKIDRSFIREIPKNPDDCAIAEAIISMAHSLGLQVVAEGVQNDAQAAFLLEKGCDLLQGFHFARPMDKDALKGYLLRQNFGHNPLIAAR